ncbi:hypothetical protein ACFE04_016730 [Oxalis oulophora]
MEDRVTGNTSRDEIERLPTFDEKVQTSLSDPNNKNEQEEKMVDVTKLESLQRHIFIEKLITKIEEDNLRLLMKIKERTNKVGLKFPTIEVRYKNLSVETECEGVINIGRCKTETTKFKILRDATSIEGLKKTMQTDYILKAVVKKDQVHYWYREDQPYSYIAVASTAGIFCLMVMLLFGGLIIPRSSLPGWLKWGFWLSPVAYAEIAASVNEFLAPRWQKISSLNVTTGDEVLNQYDLNYSQNFYWISIGALVGFWLIFNFGFTFALSFLKSPGSSRAIISREKFLHLDGRENSTDNTHKTTTEFKNIGMILPFAPLAISFENVQYFVDIPQEFVAEVLKLIELDEIKDALQITVFGEREAVNSYLGSYFGYHHDQLGIVSIVLLVYPVLFSYGFAYGIAKFNFQKR